MADDPTVAALREELRGYELLGKSERAALVRAELERLGVETATTSGRARRRSKSEALPPPEDED